MAGNDALDVIDLCYRALDDPEAWQAMVCSLAKILDADAGDLVLEDYVSSIALAFGSTGFDPEYRASYDHSFVGGNPWIQGLLAMPLGRAFGSHMEPEGFAKSEYYNEWLRPQGIRHGMGTILEHSSTHAVQLAFVRNEKSREHFSTERISFLERLIPHMQRTWRLQKRLQLADEAWRPMEAAVHALSLPAFLVDPSKTVLLTNCAAENFLARRSDFRVNGRKLSIAVREADESLCRAIAAACRLEYLVSGLERSEFAVASADPNLSPVLVQVVPLRANSSDRFCNSRSLVILIDPEEIPRCPAGRLKEVWSLTTTEEALAYALANGMTTAQYAAQTGTSVGTARWHLKNIQAKMDAASTAAVVARVHTVIRSY